MERQLWKPVLGSVVGAGAGFAYYYFIGCAAGGCPIQSNPYVMTGYGLIFGLILGIPGEKEQSVNNE